MTIYLFKFNNYYNRIVKRHNTIAEYEENGSNLAIITGVNFNPNDGIYTSQIVNYNGEAMPDYLLVADEYNQILSRWYVIESRRTRGGQFEVELYRDVIAEWYNDIINAPCFIEKATVGMYDTAIFNNEDMTFNQIKTRETLIKDKAGCGWYVGYVAANAERMQLQVKKTPFVLSGEYSSFESYPFNKYAHLDFAYDTPENLTFTMFIKESIGFDGFAFGWDSNKNIKTPIFNYRTQTANESPKPYVSKDGTIYPGIIETPDTFGFDTYIGRGPYKFQNVLMQALEKSDINWNNNSNSITNYRDEDIRNLRSESGKIYKIGDKYYKIRLTKTKKRNFAFVKASSSYGTNYKTIANVMYGIQNDYILRAGNDTIVGSIEWESYGYQIVYDQFEYSVSATNIDFLVAKNGESLEDIQSSGPYKMFAIPYGKVNVSYNQGGPISCDPDFAHKLISEIILNLGDKLYDIQLLPYAPMEDYHFNDTSTLDFDSFSSSNPKNQDKLYTVLSGNSPNSIETFIIYPNSYETERTIYDHAIDIATDSISQKIQNCCDMYRLVSPNYNGQFEFSAAKNYGVRSWNIVQSCKPYTPYIKIAPDFNGLYGTNFQDARGLICGGDFSISQYESAWTNYQIQNKNYQVMFDRQIQNMEVNNSVQRARDAVNAIAGGAQGVASGAMAGFAVGGIPGAIVGGSVGGLTSAAAGIADVKLNEKLRKESIDFTKDQFGYSLQNIQALPYSLTKVGTQNADFKLFPFLEYFTCTEFEKQALIDKLRYNGMTVMRIGQINDFIQPDRSYIKAKLIRLETVSDDYHVINAISKELNEGVYI